MIAYSLTYLDSYSYYLLLYGITALLVFAILNALRDTGLFGLDGPSTLYHLKGLSRFNPGLAYALGLSLFSLAGIPPLAGFFAKFMVISSILGKGYFIISLVLVITSVISTANYLKLIKIIHFDAPLTCTSSDSLLIRPIRYSLALLIASLALLLLLLILKPSPFFLLLLPLS